MDTEVRKTSTSPPNSTRKNPWPWLIGLAILAFLLVMPLLSLRNYADVLLATPPAPVSPKADCGVVLTGAPGRVREGFTLLSRGAFEKLIISGVHQRATLADVFPEVVFYPEIRPENVILERRSVTTAGNAQQSLPVVETLQCRSLLLITHDYHMHRAQKTFAQIFPAAIQIIPYPIPSGRMHARHMAEFKFWTQVFEEWYKYAFYSIFVF